MPYRAEDLSAPFFIQTPYMTIPLFILFLLNPRLLARLFRQYRPNEISDKHKNKPK